MKLVKRFVEKYKDKPNTKIFFMGDEIDAITRSDKRYDSLAVHPRYRDYRNFIDRIVDDFVEVMDPIRDKIVCGVDSNHNFSYRKVSDSDPHYRISRALEYERLGHGGFVPVVFRWYKSKDSRSMRTRTVTFHLTHGKPTTAITPGGSINTLASDAQWFISDVMAHGHTHRLSAGLSRIMFECDSKHQTYKKRKQHLIQTGSFLKSYSVGDEFSPYSEVKRYPPIDLGWAFVDVEFAEKTEPRIRCGVEEY